MKAAFLATAAAIAGTAIADGHVHRAHDALHHRRAVQAGGEPVASEQQPEKRCGCETEVITYYGSPSLVPLPATTSSTEPEAVTTVSSTSVSTVTVKVTSALPTVTMTTSEAQSPPPAETSVPAETPSSVAPEETSTPPAAPVETPSTSSVVTSTPPVAPAPSTSSTPVVELPTPVITSFSSTGVYTIPAKTLTVTDSTTVCGATGTEVPSGTHTVGGVTTVVETATTVTCPVATVKPSGTTVTSVIENTSYVCPSAGTYTIAPITTFVPSSTMLVYPTPATYTPGTYTKPEQTMTVTNTDYHYVCPESSTSSPVPTSSVTPTSSPVPTSSATSTSTPALDLGISVSLGLGGTSTSAAPSATPSNSGSNVMGMTYSPYANDGNCKDQATVLKDVAEIAQKGFTHVRVYATDCNGLENIGKAAKQHNLKMILGVYIDGSGIPKAQEQVDSINQWAQWDLVTLIVVGNEAVNDGYVSIGQLAGLISSAKQTWAASGYTGDVTTTEPINIWEQQGKSLCSSIDVIGANIHPFFNPKTTADQAGKFARSSVGILEKICPGKDVMILETGWPKNGEANGAAVPGKEQQAAAIKGLVEEVGKQSVFFSYVNDLWKEPGNFDVERYWGCIENF